ncbi:MAG: glycosyltransferase family 4 protein [Elusimicrobia bacterium]|nr:glycosyltransferase family 4 protein [Elusimicrobiota bacterium]
MIRILHITAHMSGGLARVLLSTLKYAARFTPEVSHEIVTMGEISDAVRLSFAGFEDKLHLGESYGFIASKASEADIVQIEYWNHPLLYKFFLEFQLPPARVMLCCHVSGFFRPQLINERAVRFSDIFLAATRATAKHELFAGPDRTLKDKLRFIRFPVDVERFQVSRETDPGRYTVGYIGTVSYAKLHRNFLRMCAGVNVENAKFIVCGEDSPDNIESESKSCKPGLFEFTGYQEDVSKILKKIDVFGYPLASTHFGSGEQAIIEAMYFGIPVVAFANAAEAEIIENGVTGLLVDSEEAYVAAIEHLHRHPEERSRLGANAKKFVETKLGPQACFAELDRLYRELLERPKTEHVYAGAVELSPAAGDPCLGSKLLVESLAGKGPEFSASMAGDREADAMIAGIETAMKTKTKGSLNQYLYFFPDDPYLNLWVGLIAHKEGRREDAMRHFRKSLQPPHRIGRAEDYLNASLAQATINRS